MTILEDVDVFEGNVFPDPDIAFDDNVSAFLALRFTVFRVINGMSSSRLSLSSEVMSYFG